MSLRGKIHGKTGLGGHRIGAPGQIALSVKSELKILSVENICIQIIYEIRPN
ncbi:Uncharacterised protein [Salmonella enterica subsp. enterica serovar Typhi]|nr:Uncharacterised protein [Salmonella enterica subsp. enterica serovar Typhi]CTT99921.1 Uncharacterised protein [Escherichia coli]CFX82222.1 Uncharacterised protein [Salmonella enterica subsp. enterica serovar Typhi]CFY15772.1 Uncharacterised protein [Salmonella enterica subsp. enterica serovar Typhi]CGJ37412.1 Uncharacterised protein [Salmonella enterica subsp. enterica serovar Typhi]